MVLHASQDSRLCESAASVDSTLRVRTAGYLRLNKGKRVPPLQSNVKRRKSMSNELIHVCYWFRQLYVRPLPARPPHTEKHARYCDGASRPAHYPPILTHQHTVSFNKTNVFFFFCPAARPPTHPTSNIEHPKSNVIFIY